MVNVVSIYALREESDPVTLHLTKRSKNFNPHSPCGERPTRTWPTRRTSYFNPHSPCGERRSSSPTRSPTTNFNPHSPCGERLSEASACSKWIGYFNPHSPCGERLLCTYPRTLSTKFQSTLPLRGATQQIRTSGGKVHISIHTPLAGSDVGFELLAVEVFGISIHTPLAGSDLAGITDESRRYKFQSTLPLRGATRR